MDKYLQIGEVARALSRSPAQDEMGWCVDAVTQAGTTQTGLEDIAAVLLSTIEAVAH